MIPFASISVEVENEITDGTLIVTFLIGAAPFRVLSRSESFGLPVLTPVNEECEAV